MLTETAKERRKKKNRARKLSRARIAALYAMPPVVGLSRAQYARLVGPDANYDAYAEAFIAGAKWQHRHYEFPLEPLGGVSFPSVKRHRKGMAPTA